jgi:hypothetical protein
MTKGVKIGIGVGVLALVGIVSYRLLRTKKENETQESGEKVVCDYPNLNCINKPNICYNPFSIFSDDGIQKCYK